ncbi:MAG: hypothetical protein ACXWJC_03500 [Croceibacterium sp.]
MARQRKLDSIEVRAKPESLAFALTAQEVAGAADAFDFAIGFADSTEAGARLIDEWLGDLTVPQLIAVAGYFRPHPKRRGRKRGSGKRTAEIATAQITLHAQLGREPSRNELAQEIARMTGNRSQFSSILRDLARHLPRTKKA